MQEITTQNDFDYSLVDFETQEFLQERSNIIYGIQSKSTYEIGKQLVKAQEVLAKKRYGCFEEWYRSLGFKTTKAYEYINHYKFISSQSEELNIKTFEELPKKLQSEMSKPSANPELNQKVFDGDITTHKKYKELERKLKESEERNKRLAEQALQKEVIEKEVVPEDYESTKQLNSTLLSKNKSLSYDLDTLERTLRIKENELKQLEENTSKSIALKDAIESLQADKNKLETSLANLMELNSMATEFENFFDTKMAPMRFKTLIQGLGTEIQIDKIRDILTVVDVWLNEMNAIVPEQGRNIIEGEIING